MAVTGEKQVPRCARDDIAALGPLHAETARSRPSRCRSEDRPLQPFADSRMRPLRSSLYGAIAERENASTKTVKKRLVYMESPKERFGIGGVSQRRGALLNGTSLP